MKILVFVQWRKICVIIFLMMCAFASQANGNIDPNIVISEFLGEEKLNFQVAKPGASISLNSIIVMPSSVGEGGGFLSLSFDRADIDANFIGDFFYGKNLLLRQLHTFSYKQLEPILYPDKLILNVHDGVVLHLRNKIDLPSDYDTFNKSGVSGTVVDVRGNVYYSEDHDIIRKRLDGFFVKWEIGVVPNSANAVTEILPGGDIKMTRKIQEESVPVMYEPKVIE